MIDIQFMRPEHIEEVTRIESDTFITPWTRSYFEKEMKNKIAVYIVALQDRHVIGYAGMWHIVNEGHIVNVAVKEEKRRLGVGSLLIRRLFDIAAEKEMIALTLEVRMSNTAGQRLYHKLGFKAEGIRRRYYEETGEDAIIMNKVLGTG